MEKGECGGAAATPTEKSGKNIEKVKKTNKNI